MLSAVPCCYTGFFMRRPFPKWYVVADVCLHLNYPAWYRRYCRLHVTREDAHAALWPPPRPSTGGPADSLEDADAGAVMQTKPRQGGGGGPPEDADAGGPADPLGGEAAGPRRGTPSRVVPWFTEEPPPTGPHPGVPGLLAWVADPGRPPVPPECHGGARTPRATTLFGAEMLPGLRLLQTAAAITLTGSEEVRWGNSVSWDRARCIARVAAFHVVICSNVVT